MMIRTAPDVILLASVYVAARARSGSATVTVQVAVLVVSPVAVAVIVASPPLTEVTPPVALTAAM